MNTRSTWLGLLGLVILALVFFGCSGGGGGPAAPELNVGLLDGPCAKDGTCGEGLTCSAEGKCIKIEEGGVPSDMAGLPCATDEDCGEGLVCKDGKCVKIVIPEGVGNPCITNDDCITGLICVEGKCIESEVPPTGVGPSEYKTCETDADCAEGYGCKEGKCEVIKPLTFSKAYYGTPQYESAESIDLTKDGGYIVAGSKVVGTEPNGVWIRDILVLKLDSDGKIEWQKTYGGEKDDYVRSIKTTSDGGYIAVGHTKSYGAGGSDILVLKLDSDGKIGWQRVYGGAGWDIAKSIQQETNGDYIVAGSTDSFGEGHNNIWVLKLRSSGSLLWQKVLEEGSDDAYNLAESIDLTSDGDYIVAGSKGEFQKFKRDILVLKLDSGGKIGWQKTYNLQAGLYSFSARSIKATSDGGYIVVSSKEQYEIQGSLALLVLKLDSGGKIEWMRSYGGISDYNTASIQETSDGYIIASTCYYYQDGFDDIWLLKLEPDGEIEWDKRYGVKKAGGGWNYDRAASIQVTSDGGYIVAGETAEGPPNSDLLILKINSDGEFDYSCPGVDVKEIYHYSYQFEGLSTDPGFISTDVTADVKNEKIQLISKDINMATTDTCK